MIRQLLLVGRKSYPVDPPEIPGVTLSDPFDVKPIAWPVTAGMSHSGYLVLLSAAEYQQLANHKRIKGVTMHDAGTKAKPVPTKDILASLGLESGEDNV